MVLALAGLAIGLPAGAQEAGYIVKPGDVLAVSVWKEEALQGDVLGDAGRCIRISSGRSR